MPKLILAAILLLVALVECWSLVRARRTGRIASRGWTFQRDENPAGFWVVALVDIGILVAIIVLAVHTAGRIGDYRL